MSTVVKLLTAEEFQQLPESRWSELIHGVVVETMPGAPEHGSVAMTIGWLLSNFVRPNHLGIVLSEAGFVLERNPDMVRAPDIAFVSASKAPASGPSRRFWEIAPDLAVEVNSPTDRPGEAEHKVGEWMAAGTRLLWSVYPDRQTVVVVHSLQEREELSAADLITGGDVLPGFSARVAEFFA